jgi:hypothetical protein
MYDERYLYRVQWPALRQHLYRLCLGPHKTALLERFCGCGASAVTNHLRAAVDAWRQAILQELEQKTRTPNAWPGWQALIPLFGHSERLYRDIGARAKEICDEYSSGRIGILWHVLHAYFTDWRDELDGGKKTRLEVWRKIDRIRRELNAQRRRQGLGDFQHLPELVAQVLAVIKSRDLKNAPTTVEGVWSYFTEFDPAYSQPYDEEMQGLELMQELTDRDWMIDLTRALEKLPTELRQALEIRYELRSQPMFRTEEERRRYYGCSDRTLRDRADKALKLLRESLGL